ncbi:hypothetical protein DFQ27_002883 [Actinomortierella ambigua]|uniref:Lipase n=1 Tax=Actinomortierella ambigua TaxID=1343610 RepID=A0A9P6Q987_9FUNG|nr:hypothetical protein DFQ27_002883 [Actinomortierella ambigua]
MRIQSILASVVLGTTATLSLVQAADQWPFMTKRSGKPETPRWNDLGCQPTAEHPNPLVLIHGLYSQGERHWKVFAPKFAAKGYCVFTPTYGSMHGQSLVNGLDAIEDSAQQIATYIDTVLTATGASKVDILAHSEGSTVGQYYLLKLNGGAKVDRWSAIGGNFYGTTYLGLSSFLQKLGVYDAVEWAISPLCKACFQLVEGSDFFKDLYAQTGGRDTVPDVSYFNLASRYDEYVVESGFMRDKNNSKVRNVYLQDLCPTDHAKHFDLLTDPVVFNAVNAHLDDQAEQDVGCGDFH